MYRCPRLVDGPVVVELPHVMYKMPVYNVKRGEITSVSPADKSCPDALILEARQEAVLRRLQTLKEQLDRLQSTRVNTTTAAAAAAAATTPAVPVLGAAACSSPIKTQRSDLLRQQESVLYRLSLLKVKLGQLSVKEDEVKMEQPLALAERHKGIIKVISTLREEILFFADLQKSMEEGNEDPSRPLQDLVVSASPSAPPLSLVVVRRLLGQAGTHVYSSSRTHSSISQVSRELHEAFTESPMEVRTQHSFGFSVQWTDVRTPTLMISPLRQTRITGEANILRYLSRLLPPTSPFHYEATGSYSAIAEVDLILDVLEEQLVRGGGKERMAVVKMVGDRLVRSAFLCGSVCGLADILAWSLLRQSGQVRSGQGQQEVVRWMAKMDAMTGLDLDRITNQQQQQRNKQTTTTAAAAAAVVSSPSKGKKHFGRKELEKYLKKLGIQYKVREHKEVFTVEELMKQVQDLPGVVTKNLFLKDKKKKLYLLSTKHDTEIDLKTIAKQLGTKDLRFADESVLLDTLRVKQGSVSPLALVNDTSDHLVTFLIESSAIDPSSVPFVYFHPMCNASTLGLTPQDLEKFLAATGHSPTCVTLK